jgi:hypothetical protein
MFGARAEGFGWLRRSESPRASTARDDEGGRILSEGSYGRGGRSGVKMGTQVLDLGHPPRLLEKWRDSVVPHGRRIACSLALEVAWE